jgi:hypothetical protein
MESKKAHSSIDLPIKAYRLHHLVHQPDASRSNRPNTRGNLVDRTRATQHRATVVTDAAVLALQPSLDLTFETPKLSS